MEIDEAEENARLPSDEHFDGRDWHEVEVSAKVKPYCNLKDAPQSREVPRCPEHDQPIRTPEEASQR